MESLREQNVINIRQVFARFQELENDMPDDGEERLDALTEYDQLRVLLRDCAGNGNDEKWRGDWYPATLIRDDHFTDYAQELADAYFSKQVWPMTCIDWEQAARELQMDYTAVEFDGVTYWTR